MVSSTWRKQLSVWRSRLYLYPQPDPLPHTRFFWLATGLVALLVSAFSAYFIIYLAARHNVYTTNAEDLGNMDQAIWNTIHGNMLHQTICNPVNDVNCYSFAGTTRFAIHFEPILFLISLFYLVWPSPITLQVIQTLVVASGAFPAFWLARLRLRNELASVAIAALYLLYPAQQLATESDFHAVTFTSALLLFTLYFMYTRRTVWLFVFALLSMACKEEIPLVVAFFGLWSILFQQRWRTGLALALLGAAWAVLGFYLIPHIFSPTGHPLLISRYADLGKNPVQIVLTVLLHPIGILKQHILEHNHFYYLRTLFTPAGYLPVFAPWVLVMALPSLAINLLSSDFNMYSGLYQYNAEIVPVLIFSTIEAIVLIIWVVQWWIAKLREPNVAAASQNVATNSQNVTGARLDLTATSETDLAPARGDAINRVPTSDEPSPSVSQPSKSQYRRFDYWLHVGLLVVLLGLALFSDVRADEARGFLPFSQGFQWPQATPHTELASRFIAMIPDDASVSAQSALVPHISHRVNIYLFPYAKDYAKYIFLDVTSDIYPFFSAPTYIQEVKQVLFSGHYGVVAAQDGYLLLKRGLAPPGISPYSPTQTGADVLPDLGDSFCSFINVSPQEETNPLQAVFTSSSGSAATLDLTGFGVATPQIFSVSANYMQITTYWKVSAPITQPLQVVAFITDKDGKEHFASTDFPALSWCPTTAWKPGMVVQMKSGAFYLHHIPNGLAHVAIALLPLPYPLDRLMDVQPRLPLQIVSAPGGVTSTPTNGLQLATITIVS